MVHTVEIIQPETPNPDSKRYQDSIIASNYNFQIEQLQLKHSQILEQLQSKIATLKSEREALEQRLSDSESNSQV